MLEIMELFPDMGVAPPAKKTLEDGDKGRVGLRTGTGVDIREPRKREGDVARNVSTLTLLVS